MNLLYNIKTILIKKYIFFLVVFHCTNLIGQNIDSLKVALKSAKDDTTKCYILSMMIENEPNEEAWPKYNEQLKSIAEKNLKLNPENKNIKNFYLKHLSNTLNDKGLYVTRLGDVETALECYHQSLKINESLNNKVGMSISFNDLGTIYYNQNDLQKALEYFNKSLTIQIEIKDKIGESNSLNNIGLTYKAMGNINKALYYYNKSLEIQKTSKNKSGEGATLSNIGKVYAKLKDYSKALLYFKKGLEIQESIKDIDGISSTLNNLANLEFTNNNYELAFQYASKGIILCKNLGFPDNIGENALILKKIFHQKKNISKELEMYELYILMRDSTTNEKNRKASIKSQYRYEYEKMAAADSVKVSEEKKITEAQLKQEKTQRFALYFGLLLVVLFAIFIFNRFKVTQRQNNIIIHQKEEVEKQRLEADNQREIVQEKQKEIIASITYAKRLQNAILPRNEYINKYFPDNFVFYKPKDIVAGDFYWMYVNDTDTFISVADSTGHGVPGAMVSIVCSNALDKAVKEFGLTDTGEILDKTTDLVLDTFAKSGEEISDGMDISLLRINNKSKQITWSGANNQLWIVTEGVLKEIKANKQPIGKSDNRKNFTTHVIPFENEITIYLMTDGYADQFGGEKGKKFKYKQLQELLFNNHKKSLNQQQELLAQHFNGWKKDLEQVDDVTIIGIKIIA